MIFPAGQTNETVHCSKEKGRRSADRTKERLLSNIAYAENLNGRTKNFTPFYSCRGRGRKVVSALDFRFESRWFDA